MTQRVYPVDMDVLGETAPSKPLLRGVSHEFAAGAAVVGWILLASHAASTAAAAAAHVYGASLFALFAVSAAYHRPRWSRRARAVMRRLDHSAIFLLIAGTYTPMCLLLGGTAGWALLATVWAGAALGVLQSIFWARAPKALVAGLAVALGWAVVPTLPPLRAALGSGALSLLLAGGIAYTAGAVVYARRWPDPFPRVFGYHEVFHALVIAAGLCHYAVVLGAVGSIR